MSTQHPPPGEPALPTLPDATRFPFARVSNLALVAAVAFAWLALRRYATFHNETFDLAFYARLTWGLGRGDLYQPLTNSYFWGLHASPVLFVLGLLGRLFPIVPLLLVVQAAAIAAAAVPLARIAARRAGHPLAADLAALAYLLYPTVSTAATYEFHPSALALFPLALALDALDARNVRRGVIALLVAATCREDVALLAGLTGLALALKPEHRRAGLLIFAGFTAYFALYMFVIAPRYLPPHGSLELHYGGLGGTPGGVLRALVLHPIATIKQVATPAKLLYAPRLLVPVAFLSLLAPRWLLPAAAVLAINFLSSFPTAVQIQSHYAALAVPFIFASAAHGAGRLAAAGVWGLCPQAGTESPHPSLAAQRALVLAAVAVAVGTLHMHRRAGATPISRRWEASAFRRDARAVEAAQVARWVSRTSSVAAPDHVLPHLAERPSIERIPWQRAHDELVLSTEYRSRFHGTQDLWRSTEEVLTRNTLAGTRYGLFATSGRYLLLRRGYPVRAFARGRYIEVQPAPGPRVYHVDVGRSLAIAGFEVRAADDGRGSIVTLLLVARERWPHDLGVELGWGPLHPNGDRQDPARIIAALLYDGLFSPAHVRVGEVSRTEVHLPATPDELRAAGTLYFGARRIDGSRLDAASAHWTPLPLRE